MKTKMMKRALAMALTVATLGGTALTASAEDVIQTILSTGTTQAFSAAAVSQEDLNSILQAGLSAASAINQQPWYFVALTNPELMAEISSGGGSGFGSAPKDMGPSNGAPQGGAPEGNMPGAPAAGEMPAMSSGAKAALGDSPAAILIYMDESTKSPNPNFDCGLACQNMVIAANALGYGTKIISSPTSVLNGEKHDALCEKLGVHPALKAVAVLLIGYTDTEIDGATGASVRNTLAEKVSFVD